jgi:hypothetical protein
MDRPQNRLLPHGQERRGERDIHRHKERPGVPLAICRRSPVSCLGLQRERVLQASLHGGTAGAGAAGRVHRRVHTSLGTRYRSIDGATIEAHFELRCVAYFCGE